MMNGTLRGTLITKGWRNMDEGWYTGVLSGYVSEGMNSWTLAGYRDEWMIYWEPPPDVGMNTWWMGPSQDIGMKRYTGTLSGCGDGWMNGAFSRWRVEGMMNGTLLGWKDDTLGLSYGVGMNGWWMGPSGYRDDIMGPSQDVGMTRWYTGALSVGRDKWMIYWPSQDIGMKWLWTAPS